MKQRDLPDASTLSDDPLVSVVIATRNRRELLMDSVHSVLNQTYKTIEVIVVDDGSTDDTESVLTSHSDPRVRYVKREWGGISAARNAGTEQARGEWIAVHDDDDLMLPRRIEEQLGHVNAETDFVFGAFVNFDDETGELQLHHGRNYGYGAALMTGFAPGHSTWLVRTAIMRAFPYDEGLTSAVDNNVSFRMLRSGVRFAHSGVICVLRRVHSGRITNTGADGQKYVAGLNLKFLQAGIPKKKVKDLWEEAKRDWGPVDKTSWESRLLPYLPDHLVRRSGVLNTVSVDTKLARDETIAVVGETLETAELTWAAFVEQVGKGAHTGNMHARLREPENIERLLAPVAGPAASTIDSVASAAYILMREVNIDEGTDFIVLATAPTDAWTEEALTLTRGTCRMVDATAETLTGLIVVRTLHGVDALRQGPLKWATSFRIISPNGIGQVADSLQQFAQEATTRGA